MHCKTSGVADYFAQGNPWFYLFLDVMSFQNDDILLYLKLPFQMVVLNELAICLWPKVSSWHNIYKLLKKICMLLA